MRLLLSILMAVTLGSPAFAGPLEDGLEAYKKGKWDDAVLLLRPLAEKGNAAAEEKLGRLYERGKGVQRDYAAAAMWYRKSAEKGDAAAQARLALMLRLGMGAVVLGAVRRQKTESKVSMRAEVELVVVDGDGEMIQHAVAEQRRAFGERGVGAPPERLVVGGAVGVARHEPPPCPGPRPRPARKASRPSFSRASERRTVMRARPSFAAASSCDRCSAKRAS